MNRLGELLTLDLAHHVIPEERGMMMMRVSKDVRGAMTEKKIPVRIKVCDRGYLAIMEGLEHTSQRANIVVLDFSGVHILKQGAHMLAGILHNCPELVRINLDGNHVGAEGVGSLAGVLGQCRLLTHLNIEGNWIGAKGAGSLVQRGASLTNTCR